MKTDNKDRQKITRDKVYNQISRVLTEFEEYLSKYSTDGNMTEYENEMYITLITIQNNWEEIVAEY